MGATFGLTKYENASGIGFPLDYESIDSDKAKEIFDENFLGVSSIDIYINPSDSKEKMSETAAHEGGHAAFALENPFMSWVWGIIGDPSKEGHDKNNPNGRRADHEQNKASTFIKNLTLADWERIAEEFNKNKK